MVDLLLIILGVAIVLNGADNLTDGAVRIARRLNMPEMIIGLTIVAFGTSMPELCVSLASALQGTSDMAVGNVIGSNIFNAFLIIGVCAIIHPMSVSMTTIRRDLPFEFIATLMLIFFLVDGSITKGEGLLMLLLFTAYMVYTIKNTKPEAVEQEKEKPLTGLRRFYRNTWVLIGAGLAELVIGSNIFVDHAVNFAKDLGVSEAVIGITILGAGTSLPELATSVVAALKGRTSMAMGNVIGSCVFNILMILGITSVVTPLSPTDIRTMDLGMLFAGAMLLWLFSFTKNTMERWEGFVLTVCFIAYMAHMLYTI